MQSRWRNLAVFFTVMSLAPSAAAYKLIGVYWPADDGPVRYALDPAGSDDISDGSDLDAVRNAFRSWSCVEGSRLRFLEADVDGVAAADLDDGINSVFWDEDGATMQGPATLGITLGTAGGGPDQLVLRTAADIAFNGKDHTWSTGGAGSGGVDVESVAVHEAGHFLGLDHPCTDIAETDCLGPDEAVMTPALPDGAIIRTPFADDMDGVLEVYPQAEDDDSTCDGPYRVGEPCGCNDECIDGLLCSAAGGDYAVCVPNCGANPAGCPSDYVCVFAARDGDGDAPAACVAASDPEELPDAALCERDTDCQDGAFCAATPVIGRSVCQRQCDGDGDCNDGYACTDGLCTGAGATAGIRCQEPEPAGEPEPDAQCQCQGTLDNDAGWPPGAAFLGILVLFGLAQNRRRRPPHTTA